MDFQFFFGRLGLRAFLHRVAHRRLGGRRLVVGAAYDEVAQTGQHSKARPRSHRAAAGSPETRIS